jgi:Periplasmic component of the Tol biopolymer transport system
MSQTMAIARRRRFTFAFSFLLLSAITCAVLGFGKNKVEYEKFTWKYLGIPHFNVYFHQDQGSLPRISSQWIENAYDVLSTDFKFRFKKQIPLILYGSTNNFERTNVIPDLLPEGVGGFTTQMKNRIVIPFDGSYEELRHVLHHELVHGFQNTLLFDQLGSSLISGSEMSMPLWFAEGMAEYLSTGWNSEADMFLMDAAIFGSVPPPGPQLDGYMAYKGGQSFLYFTASSLGDTIFSKMLKHFGESKNVERAFKEVYGRTIEELGEEWRYQLKQIYWPEIGRRQDPVKTGKALTSHSKDRDNFNLKPRVSPDGTKVAYFSDLKDFTRILIVNRSGKILEEISESGFAGSFESFHPFRTGVCWAPSSDRIAFVTENKGKDELRIIDIKNKKLVRTFQPNLSSVCSPDWSADGKSIVFCGVDKDFCDLFLCDVQSGMIKRLTNNILFESDPRFSRDGKSVIFSSQDTSGIALRKNNIQKRPTIDLFSLNLVDGSTTQLTHGPSNKKSPCFSPDGASILYVSDRNGIDNLCIAPLSAPDSAKPLTDVIGGCQNPDWSRDSNSVVYCLFQKSGWDIWQIDDPLHKLKNRDLVLTKWAASLNDTSMHFFEPVDSSENQKKHSADTLQTTKKKHRFGKSPMASADKKPISETDNIQVEDTTQAIPKDTNTIKRDSLLSAQAVPADSSLVKKPKESAGVSNKKDSVKTPSASPTIVNFDSITARPYHVIFKPDLIMLGAGVDTYYGSGYAGQCVAVFSDLLGNHQITIAGDIQGNLAEYTHIFASYLNLEHTINYGIGAFYNRDYTSSSVFGDSLYFDTDAGMILTAACPFSMFSRLELDANYQNLFREPYVFTSEIDKDTGRANLTYNILVPSLSYVYDDILWGMTGPLNGTRSQAAVEFSPPVKHVNAAFFSFDLDFRRYFHVFKRFVWANKVAFGASVPLGGAQTSARKYFLGGDENWLTYETNEAGYRDNVNNFFYSDIIVPFRGWSYLDLIGTKYAVVNTEFRFPFIKEFSIAWPLQFALRYINGAVFADIGNAWNKEDEFKNVPLPKHIYGGVGYGLRANLGIFVLRYDYAWKTDWNTYLDSPKSYVSLGAEF